MKYASAGQAAPVELDAQRSFAAHSRQLYAEPSVEWSWQCVASQGISESLTHMYTTRQTSVPGIQTVSSCSPKCRLFRFEAASAQLICVISFTNTCHHCCAFAAASVHAYDLLCMLMISPPAAEPAAHTAAAATFAFSCCCPTRQAPFRLARIILFGGLGVGAAIGLLVILGRLAAALKGGEGAPDLTQSITNLGINVAAIAVLSFLVLRDLQAREKDTRVTSREEALGRLLVSE